MAKLLLWLSGSSMVAESTWGMVLFFWLVQWGCPAFRAILREYQKHEGVIRTDKDFRIIYIDRVAERLYGWKYRELKGKSPDILLLNSRGDFQEKIFQTISSGKTFQGRALNIKKGGSLFYCQIKIYPIVSDDGIIGYIGKHQDVTPLTTPVSLFQIPPRQFN